MGRTFNSKYSIELTRLNKIDYLADRDLLIRSSDFEVNSSS